MGLELKTRALYSRSIGRECKECINNVKQGLKIFLLMNVLFLISNQDFIIFNRQPNLSMANIKKKDQKQVHRFTQNALLKFRPVYYEPSKKREADGQGMVSKVSSILSNFLAGKFYAPQKTSFDSAESKKNTLSSKSILVENRSNNRNRSFIQPKGDYFSRTQSDETVEGNTKLTPNRSKARSYSFPQEISSLTMLQKITSDTFLIGNESQIDSITINGIYEDVTDTDLNWSLNVRRKIHKLVVDTRKCLIAIECDGEILLYKYDSKQLKAEPVCFNKIRLLGQSKFLLFLKDSQIGVFYGTSATVYQMEDNNKMRMIFNKKYGVKEQLQLFQIPKPFESTLNIFFIDSASKDSCYVLWRLQFQLKNIGSSTGGFKALQRIYDIPKQLGKSYTITNFSKDIFVINLKSEMFAIKDGYIIDHADTNIQADDSVLVYRGDQLLHVCETKLYIYDFKIITNTQPNRIAIKSIDSIEINKDPRYVFLDCLEMLKGNFVLFFQIDPQFNHKLKGEIEYTISVTQKISIQQKLKEIFAFKSADELKRISQKKFSIIQQKCDIAFKIGLNRRQVYLQLWNISNKRDIQDYKYLLDTMDYETIRLQIEKKLKKQSMNFNEVYKLEQSCFEMLKDDLFSHANFTSEVVKNYVVSHFLLRKMVFFREIHQKIRRGPETEQNKGFTVDIHTYNQYVKLQLKSILLDYASKICFEEADYSHQYRLFIRSFKFSLMLIYPRVLEDLIIQCKEKLINLLMMVPEILPYVHPEIPEEAETSLFEGLWGELRSEEWRSNLHLEQICTIYNKECVEEFIKTVWFKRNQYTLHDLAPYSKQKIIEIRQFNHSDGIFYCFIEQIFRHNKRQDNLVEIVDFLEINYSLMPLHLRGKVFLYKRLYDYFKNQNCTEGSLSSFNTFLKLKDYQLFKELFRHEKIKKGCLLKDAKKIYGSIQNGNELYNQALFNYFICDISEISDLKYILNRLNNEKREFHIENEGIYGVLIKAIQIKLKLGSENDVPFEEVMIYVENIPFSKNNPVIEDLNTIQIIGQFSQTFQIMKLNMSFLQIVERCEDVLTAIIDYQIKEKKVMQIADIKELKQVTYVILAEVQTIKEKIYKNKLNNLAYFIYVARLMEQKSLIQSAKQLLQDNYLLQYYSVDDKIIQNLVIYMYRWKLSKQPVFVQNEDYLYELLSLLPQDNIYKIYFLAEIKFSVMMSTPEHPIEFRSSQVEESGSETIQNANLITMDYIRLIVSRLSAEFIANLDIERMYEYIKVMQELCLTEENYINLTNLVDIYEVVIFRLINLNRIRIVVPKIRALIELYGEEENYSIVFCYIVLNILMRDVTQNHKKNMVRITFHTFNSPLQLLQIIEKRINSQFSDEEQRVFIEEQLSVVRMNRCYSKDNVLLDEQLLQKINEREDKYSIKFEDLIFETWAHISKNQDEFSKNLQFTLFYICLLQNPFALAKYLHVLQETINIRLLRSYLSFVFREQIFNGLNVLHFSRRMFIIVLESITKNISIELVISQYKGVGLTENEVYEQLPKDIEQKNPFAAKLANSLKIFEKKIDFLKLQVPEDRDKKTKRIDSLLSSEASIHGQQNLGYSMKDFEQNNEEEERKATDQEKIERTFEAASAPRIFDANKERKMLMERKDKNLFISCQGIEELHMRRKTMPDRRTSLLRTYHTGVAPKRREALLNSPDNSLNEDSGSVQQVMQFTESIRIDAVRETIDANDEFFNSSLPPMQLQSQRLTQEEVPNQSKPYKSSFFTKIQEESKEGSPQHPAGMKNSLVDVGRNAFEDSVDMEEPEFKVTVNLIDDEQYTAAGELAKQLLNDFGGNEADPMFNLSLIAMQNQRQFGPFQSYLKELIREIYGYVQKSTSLRLMLIKQIINQYSQIRASRQFLEYYILLENYNIKYKYSLPIRQMFPIQAIFLNSKDPKELFEYLKQYILSCVDFDNILIVAKLLHFALKKSEIKDELYFSYLVVAIDRYYNDNESSEEELLRQRQRIGGIIDQIIMVNIFVEKSELLLSSDSNHAKKKEVIGLIKECLLRKKKLEVLKQFDRRTRTI